MFQKDKDMYSVNQRGNKQSTTQNELRHEYIAPYY